MKDIKLIDTIKEEEESYVDDSLFNIASFGADMSFRELISMYEEEELIKPELQRKYVWSKNEASRFIDSILLGLPVPSIFLAKTNDSKRLIVDGYQRIMTVYDYVRGIFSGDGKTFRLSNTQNINEKWRGKSFLELTSDEQRKIRTTTIHAIIFEQKHPQNDSGMYQIFERINTSGRVLKPQEIRNCVYHGEFNKLLFDLNKHEVWRNILGNNQEDSRMADMELILRFFAFIDFKDFCPESVKQINLNKFLNDYMSYFSNMDETKRNEMTDLFLKILTYLYDNLGKKCFRTAKLVDNQVTYAKKVNPVMLDSVSTATAFAYENGIVLPQKEVFKKRYESLLLDDSFGSITKRRTTDIENIKSRISIATKILFGVDYEW